MHMITPKKKNLIIFTNKTIKAGLYAQCSIRDVNSTGIGVTGSTISVVDRKKN